MSLAEIKKDLNKEENIGGVRATLFVIMITILSSIALTKNMKSNSKQRFEDFSEIAKALEQYKKDHKEYPKAASGVWFTGGRRIKINSNWIPGLSPEYLSKVPIDPYRSKLPNHQYIYFSNGADFKLIAHGTEDATAIIKGYPEMKDPTRPTYAYGIWTTGGEKW